MDRRGPPLPLVSTPHLREIWTHGLRGDRPPADCREGGERILFAVHQRWQYTTVSDSVRIEMPRQREGKGPLRRKGDGCDSVGRRLSRAPTGEWCAGSPEQELSRVCFTTAQHFSTTVSYRVEHMGVAGRHWAVLCVNVLSGRSL